MKHTAHILRKDTRTDKDGKTATIEHSYDRMFVTINGKRHHCCLWSSMEDIIDGNNFNSVKITSEPTAYKIEF